MLRRLYDWTLHFAGHRHAETALGAVSFAESSVFPIPPDALLVPMMLANRHKVVRYTVICTIASVLGGIAGYFIGYLLFDTLGEPILRFYGLEEDFEQVAARYNDMGALMVFLGAVTPLPYKVITITSGVMHQDLLVFVLVSIVGRALRFAVTCWVLYVAGPRAKALIEKRLGLALLVMLVMVVGGLVLAGQVL